jgi:F-type H+-transporting ATPase subunit b
MVATFLVTSSQLTEAAAGGVNLDFDATLFVQAGFILLLWVVLKPLLFDPMLKLFDEREQRIEGAIKKARRIDEKSAEAKAEYDDLMAKARAEGGVLREKLRADGLRKEGDLLATVRGETQKTVDEARGATEREAAETRTALVPHTRAIAKELASRVLGREVS